MQLYDALPILTAQPSAEDRHAAPHRLYSALPPGATCSAGEWRTRAAAEIETAFAEGRTPLIVGGSGLYISALVKGLSPMPRIPEDIRRAATQKQQELGNAAFHTALAARDPVMAARLDPANTARLIRAWEVLEATGRSLADWQAEPPVPPPAHWRFEIHKIMPERETLYRNCNARFEWMMENGVIEEVENFLTRTDIPEDRPIRKALGLRPLRDYLEGRISRETAITLAQNETRHYAKRQVTWFRHQL